MRGPIRNPGSIRPPRYGNCLRSKFMHKRSSSLRSHLLVLIRRSISIVIAMLDSLGGILATSCTCTHVFGAIVTSQTGCCCIRVTSFSITINIYKFYLTGRFGFLERLFELVIDLGWHPKRIPLHPSARLPIQALIRGRIPFEQFRHDIRRFKRPLVCRIRQPLVLLDLAIRTCHDIVLEKYVKALIASPGIFLQAISLGHITRIAVHDRFVPKGRSQTAKGQRRQSSADQTSRHMSNHTRRRGAYQRPATHVDPQPISAHRPDQMPPESIDPQAQICRNR